jgi:hypothetical protein
MKTSPVEHRAKSLNARKFFYAQKRAIKKGIAFLVPDSGKALYQAGRKMLAKIKSEPETKRKLDQIRETDSRLERIGKKQGKFTFDLSKYQGREYGIGTMESDISRENDAFAGAIKSGMDKANGERSGAADASFQAAMA